MANKNKSGLYLEGETPNYFKNNLFVVMVVTACSFVGRREQFLLLVTGV